MKRAAIVVGFGLLLHGSALAGYQETGSKSVGSWKVQAWSAPDRFSFCTLQRRSGDINTISARDRGGYVMSLVSPKWNLEVKASYPVRLVGTGLNGERQAEAADTNSVTIRLGDDEGMFEAIKKALDLKVRGASGTIRIALGQGVAALSELQACWREHALTAAAADPVTRRSQVDAKPSVPDDVRPTGPEPADLSAAKAACDRITGDFDRTIADCTAVIAHRDAPAKARAEAFNKRGQAYSSKDDSDKALADYNEAIRLDPNYSDAYWNRALLYAYERNDLDRAIADLDTAIRISPQKAGVLTSRGDLYKDKGDLDRALADYNESVRLDPNLTATRMSRGEIYMAKGDYARALADFEEALRLSPDFSNAIKGRDQARAALGKAAAAKDDQVSAPMDAKPSGRGDTHPGPAPAPRPRD